MLINQPLDCVVFLAHRIPPLCTGTTSCASHDGKVSGDSRKSWSRMTINTWSHDLEFEESRWRFSEQSVLDDNQNLGLGLSWEKVGGVPANTRIIGGDSRKSRPHA